MTLKTIFLVIWLASGERHIEAVTQQECSDSIVKVEAARTLGLDATTEDGELVVRVSCGDADIVLALPNSDMPCEMGDA